MLEMLEKKFLNLLFAASAVYLLYRVRGILLPFILGFIIAYCFRDGVKKYENKYGRTIPSLFYVSLFSILVLFIFIFIIPRLFSQFTSLGAELINNIQNFNAEEFYRKFDGILSALKIEGTGGTKKYMADLATILLKWIGNLTNRLLSSSFQVANILFMIGVSPVVAFYFLRDWELMTDGIKKYLIPKSYVSSYATLTQQIDDVLHHYIMGQFYVCLIFVFYYIVLLSLLKFRYALTVGLISGLAIAIPYVGSIAVGMLAVIMNYFQFGLNLKKFLGVVVIYCLAQFLEGNFITPAITGNRMQIHPIWLLFGVCVAGSLLGVWGVLLAVPLTGIASVIIRFYIDYREKEQRLDWNGSNNR